MKNRIDKQALREKIQSLSGLSNEDKSQLLALLAEQKKYGLVWEDSTEEAEEVLRENIPVLREVKEKAILNSSPLGESKGAPNHILIEGDNLHALTALTYTHEGKVDVIYIDPPYNTGNKNFVYNDSFVDSEDSYRHSKWLSFMERRLRIAKKLLSDKGVIYISIDDNEQANLKLLCDEVFGCQSFITTLHVEMSATQGMKVKAAQMGNIVKNAEYVLVYSKYGHKNIARELLYDYRPEYDSHYSYLLSEDGLSFCSLRNKFHSLYPSVPLSDIVTMYSKEEVFKDFVDKNREFIFRFDKTTGFDDSEFESGKIYLNFISNGRSYALYNNGHGVQQMMFLSQSFGQCDDFNNSIGLRKIRGDWWKDFYKDMGNVSKEGDVVFSNGKKPVRLIKQIVKMSSNKDSCILDFFAGSGTTLHAVAQLNEEDGGNRKVIIVASSESNICEDVTYKRCVNVIKGYNNVPGLKNNNLRYYKTEFVPRDNSLTGKRKLMSSCTNLLCIKNDLYKEETSFGRLKQKPTIARYFNDGKKQMLIIYNVDAIEDIVEEIKQMPEDTKLQVYVFSTTNYAMDTDFDEVSDKVSLCALPAAIYNVYLKVLPKKKELETNEDNEEVEA